MTIEVKTINLDAFMCVKAGMTRVFDAEGNHVPVTVMKLIPNIVSQVKTQEKDGYESYQLAFGEKRESLVNNPKKGQLKKAGIEKMLTRFFEVKSKSVEVGNLGATLSYENFAPKTYVDATATTKGKGFQGVIKRHGFAGGPAAHGSAFHRTTGSIGNRATPARVFPEKKLPGHMGSEVQTVQNLIVVDVNFEKGFMLIKGSVPGSKGAFIKVSKAVKK